jgi:hypothetical protein
VSLPIPTQLAQLEHHLDGHVRYIVEAAQSCPFGGNKQWDEVLARYGGTHDAPLKRLEDAQRSGQERGATFEEVRRAAEGLRAQAGAELERLVGPVSATSTHDAALDHRISVLRAKLSRIPDEIVAQHTARVCPPKHAVAASVGSIFANATSTAKLTPWANVKFDATRVYECRNCGAPQQVELDFHCRYCRSPMNG